MSPISDDAKPDDLKPDDTVPEAAQPDESTPARAVNISAVEKPTSVAVPVTTTGAPPPPVIVPEPDTGYTADGVPTLEGVRAKIETRYGTALGATELAENTPEVRSAAERYDKMQKAAAEKLDEIRAAMNDEDPETLAP